MQITSVNWDENVGACIKHMVPELPCPACMATHDPTVRCHLTELDCLMIADGQVSQADLLPENGEWLMERFV